MTNESLGFTFKVKLLADFLVELKIDIINVETSFFKAGDVTLVGGILNACSNSF